MPNLGRVYLIGGGPGDPRLFTIGGAESLAKADVVVYDRLIDPSIIRKYAKPDSELIYVGKQADRHSMVQEDINAVLAEKALAGNTVARLKGGDVFVFGRGGEEGEYLYDHNIPFTIIPGVTSSIAGPAYAGIPVTHRDAASSFAVITGHERDDNRQSGDRVPGASEGRRRWDKIAHAADTLIFLMGVENLNEIVSQLIANGRNPETPVALVRWATWAGKQQTLTGTLENIVDRVKEAGFTAPAVTIVGDVVNLREKLRWFDTGALSNKRIIVTRAREQASDLVDRLRDENAEAIEFPLIKTVPPSTGYDDVDNAIKTIWSYNWVLFASAPAVRAFMERIYANGYDVRVFGGIRIGAVGPATNAALKEYGLVADYVPEEATGKALGETLPGVLNGTQVLLPRALAGEEALPEALEDRGAQVSCVTAYETIIDGDGADIVRERLNDGTIDAVTFTSSSTVKNFVAALGSDLPENVVCACIGPSTAKTAQELFGRAPDIIASEHTITGLIDSFKEYYTDLSK